MTWYIVKMVFRIVCGDGDHTAQFDEQLRLISAETKEEVYHKAMTIGRQEEDLFLNHQQKLVQWQFINVSEIYKLTELIDGAEIYSRIEEKDNAEQYLHIVQQKAEQLRFGHIQEMLNLA